MRWESRYRVSRLRARPDTIALTLRAGQDTSLMVKLVVQLVM